MAAHDLLRRRPNPPSRRRWTRSAACSADAPVTARSSRRCSTSPGSGSARSPRRRAPWAPDAEGRRHPQVDRRGDLRRRRRAGGCALDAGGALAACPGAVLARRHGCALREVPGLVDVLTERDVPGSNAFGIYPDGRISRSLRPGKRGIGAKRSLRSWASSRRSPRSVTRGADFWEPLAPVLGIEAALAPGAALRAGGEAGQRADPRVVEESDVEAGFAPADFGRGQVADLLRRARLHRARGRLGPARRRPAHGRGDHPDAVHGPTRSRTSSGSRTNRQR